MALNSQNVLAALDSFRIEVPSWEFAEHRHALRQVRGRTAPPPPWRKKFCDAGQVHYFTGVCPSVALHVLWDLPAGIDLREVSSSAKNYGGPRWLHQSQCFSDQELQTRLPRNERPRFAQRALDTFWSPVSLAKH